MRVEWVEYNGKLEPAYGFTMGEEPEWQEMSLHYHGEVVGAYNHWWNGPMLIVCCQDGVFRKVRAKNVAPILKHQYDPFYRF